MKNPLIADKLLKTVYSRPQMYGTLELLPLLGLPQEEIANLCFDINNENLWLRIGKGDQENSIYVGQYQAKDMEVEMFLKSGGYYAISQGAEQEKLSQQERQSLELEHLKLEIESLKRLPADQKNTRLLSWIAIAISLVAVVLELLKFLFEKKS